MSKTIKSFEAPLNAIKPLNQAWLNSALGEYVQAQEQALYNQTVGNIFGFNALQLGFLSADFLQNSRIPFVIQASENQGIVQCEAEHLPFASNTLDLVLMPHVLDFSEHPQQALREVERVLVPEGHIVMTGFNPVGAWGLRRFVSKRCPMSSALWQAHFLSPLRIKDWLGLLGFEVVSVQVTCHQMPFQNQAWLERFEFLAKLGAKYWPMFGGVYCIVAKKRVLGMRVIKPNWKKVKMQSAFVARPTKKQETVNQVSKNN